MEILVGLAQNIALLLTGALLFELFMYGGKGRAAISLVRQIGLGMALGAIGLVVMLTPWTFAPGVVFDTRSVLLSISGLFFGTVPTLVVMIVTAVFRLYQGGMGALTGALVILASGVIGIAWRRIRRQALESIPVWELFLFGLTVHITMLVLMFTLPWNIATAVLSRISLPVLLVYPLGTALFGILIIKRMKGESASETLRESESRLACVLEGSQLGLWDLDLKTGVVVRNDRWAEMLGYTLQDVEFTIKQWQDFLHPDDLERAQRSIKDHLEGRSPMHRLEYRMRTKDGQYRWILDHARVVQFDTSGKPVRMSGTHTDITERKEAEETLLKAKQAAEIAKKEWERTFDTTPDLIALIDTNHRFLRVNRAMLDRLGVSCEDILGRHCHEIVHDLPSPPAFCPHSRLLISGKEERCEVFEKRLGRTFDVSVTPLPDASGKLTGSVHVMHDITERKQAEVTLAEQRNELLTLLNGVPTPIYYNKL